MTENGGVIQLSDHPTPPKGHSSFLAKPSKAERVELLTGSALRRFLRELDVTEDLLNSNKKSIGKDCPALGQPREDR